MDQATRMSSYQVRLAEAYRHYQQGDLARAEQIGRSLLSVGARDAALDGMLGMIAVQQGRFAEGAVHLRPALAQSPGNVPLRIALAFSLANSGKLQEAGTNIPQLERIVAFVEQRQGRDTDAIARYQRVLASFPEDAESWCNLGQLLTKQGSLDQAIQAYRRAVALRTEAEAYIGLSQAFARGEQHEERRAVLVEAAERLPQDASILVALGLAESANGDFARAEAAFHAAITHDASAPGAYLEFGMMLESLNRLDDLAALIDRARANGATGPELSFLEAWLFRRTDRLEEALALADSITAGINPARHAQLVGEISDRQGKSDRAFSAFADMNRHASMGPAADHARARDFPAEIKAFTTAAARLGNGHEIASPAGRTPTFIVGFPRSGTTLLDTLLMNLPGVEVLEETPLVERLQDRAGGISGLADLSSAEVEALRSDYWNMFNAMRPDAGPPVTVIDKFPLHMVRMPLIYRLFPTAPIIFVERHPCDVVLSCFMARFQTNKATVHFHDIHSAAHLYDLAMQAWEKAAEQLPLRVHTIRYERMIDDLEGEMRGALQFLGLPWTPEVLDNQGSAGRRRHIATASYAQVGEPLYARAVGRWTRYRDHLAPVLDILAPWIERMGYDL
jgi:tetratricopeptide (TPR) repeat protein